MLTNRGTLYPKLCDPIMALITHSFNYVAHSWVGIVMLALFKLFFHLVLYALYTGVLSQMAQFKVKSMKWYEIKSSSQIVFRDATSCSIWMLTSYLKK